MAIAGTAPFNPDAYKKLEDEEDPTTAHEEPSEFYTKYDVVAYILMPLTALFFGVCIYRILSNFRINTSYCRTPLRSCSTNSDTAYCCDDTDPAQTCWDDTTLECSQVSKTISTFFVQIILIILFIFYIYLLTPAAYKGIQIIKPTSTKPPNPAIQTLKDFKQRITYDCRRWVYKEKETPLKTSIDFLYTSMVALAVFRLIEDAPVILFNIFSRDSTLYSVGILTLSADIVNIVWMAWGAFSPICNCYRGKCCGDECCCDCCCDCVGCRYTCGHFPDNHVEYVRCMQTIMLYSFSAKMAAAVSQIGAVAFVDSIDEWHLWILGGNFLYGIWTVVRIYRIWWRYYYLMCFYWSRMAVNKHENYKIHELLNELLVGGFAFKVGVEKEDEFVTVVETESIAGRVKTVCDCWTCCMLFSGVSSLCGVAFLFWKGIVEVNEDLNVGTGIV